MRTSQQLLLVAVAALTACNDSDVPTEPSAGAPLFTQVVTGPVVNSLADPGIDYAEGIGNCDDTECTLREAIEFANSGATISFAPGLTGTITLDSDFGQLFINKSLTISGPGASNLAVSGNDLFRVILISSTGISVEIRGLTIRDGYAAGGAGIGITAASSVVLDGVVVTENSLEPDFYSLGGGIMHGDGVLTLRNSTVSNNTTSGNVYSQGGGIITQSTLVLENSTISGNLAIGGDNVSFGGGIYCMPSCTATLTNSTVSGNTGYQGGGIFVASPQNESINGWVTLTHSTVTANTGSRAAGIFNYGTVTLISSILAGNTGEDILHWGPAATASYSLIGTVSPDGYELTAGPDNLLSAAPLLNALASNGGPTQTHALQSGSPAIDHIPSGINNCGSTITTDQRGVLRPFGSGCDIGAVEQEFSAPSFSSSCTFTVNQRSGNRTVVVTWANAEPGVTLIQIADGKIFKKQMAPAAAGSWTAHVKTDPTYGIWGGTSRKNASKIWVPAGTACTG